MNSDEQFFYDQAGYGYNPETETPEQGRERAARSLAEAEAKALANGWWVEWQDDDEPFNDDVHDPDEYGWVALLMAHDDTTNHPYVLGSLGAVDADFGSPYRRVVAAELALEALALA